MFFKNDKVKINFIKNRVHILLKKDTYHFYFGGIPSWRKTPTNKQIKEILFVKQNNYITKMTESFGISS
jgi:hypothetical protein